MTTDLSDAAILREVEDALRILGEGRGSLSAVGERLIRRIVGLEHEMRPTVHTLGDDAE